MAGIAQTAVLVSSAEAKGVTGKLKQVKGPSSQFHDAALILKSYEGLGFQATNYGVARRLARQMIQKQQPSKIFQMIDGKYVLVKETSNTTTAPGDTKDSTRVEQQKQQLVYPTLFLGLTANLIGTGCREAVLFLLREGVKPRLETIDADAMAEHQLMFYRLKKEEALALKSVDGPAGIAGATPEAAPRYESFLSCLVVSGGGVEHDIRRACADYTISHYASEESTASSRPTAEAVRDADAPLCRFGNVRYPAAGSDGSAVFDAVMRDFKERLLRRQHRLAAEAAAKPIPDTFLDVCSWAVTPSEVWALAGLWLVDMLARALKGKRKTDGDASPGAELDAACRAEALTRARGTLVYWAALQEVPIYSPSFVDGDIMGYLLPREPVPPADGAASPSLLLDLVRDVHSVNKMAMLSKKTGMLICGGGVVKHHVLNANLMRNGADYTVILNNGQEFDGSDAGARPEEALSWGKVRLEGKYVKVYGEVTASLPLLVADVFVPAVRHRDQQPTRRRTQRPHKKKK